MAKPYGLPKGVRLRSKKQIGAVFRQGRYHALGVLRAKTFPSGAEESRFLISVKKSAANAPGRNRIKRLVREAVRKYRNRLETPHDICFFLSGKPPGPPTLAAIEEEVQQLFRRLAPEKAKKACNG